MKVTMHDDRLAVEDLTEPQWQAAMEWVSVEPINYEVWEQDHTKFVIHLPTPEQIDAFQSILQEAG